MKKDAPTPAEIPKKRRQLHSVPDLWLAVWLSRDDITKAERKRVEEEKARRKEQPLPAITLLRAKEGWTPEQQDVFAHLIDGIPCEIHTWISGNHEYQQKIKEARGRILAFPKEMSKPERPENDSVWAAVRYARNRRHNVTVIFPTGRLDG